MKTDFFFQKKFQQQNRINRNTLDIDLTTERNHMRDIIPYTLMRAA